MSLDRTLHVAFVWNQHQPYYKDTVNNRYIMPWVRLHACKDYYQMAAILEHYPRIKQTFNLTPSLLSQLEDYLNTACQDFYMRVAKPVGKCTDDDRRFLLQHYFDIHWERVIYRFPRYHELLQKQGELGEPYLPEGALEKFSDQDYLDLQVWFNLAWIDSKLREEDSFLRGLVEKGRDFTEKEKEGVMQAQREIMGKVIPIHRRLRSKGQIELMTTPFYHPIMPLIIDNHSARRALPDLPLPEKFAYREDVYAQLEASLLQYKQLFGGRPRGVWPSEQAVSPEIISICSELGFAWTISDEQILAQTMEVEIQRDEYGHLLNPEVLCQPYRVMGEGEEITIIFRDQVLSDRIGFEYQHFQAEEAAEDLIHRLHVIRERLGHLPGNFLVTISLDGENPWEWYPDDKHGFLHALYHRLSKDPYLKCESVNRYLEQNPPRRSLYNLFTGSWVDHNLARWIGSENKNKMWDYLARARQKVEDYRHSPEGKRDKAERALQNIYIAEGSDYHWWVDSMPYYLAAPFEALFRKHLSNVYSCMDLFPPEELRQPLISPDSGEPEDQRPISGPISMINNLED